MRLVGGLIYEHQVAMAKGAAPNVLPAEPDVEAVFDKGSHGQCFGSGPVNLPVL